MFKYLLHCKLLSKNILHYSNSEFIKNRKQILLKFMSHYSQSLCQPLSLIESLKSYSRSRWYWKILIKLTSRAYTDLFVIYWREKYVLYLTMKSLKSAICVHKIKLFSEISKDNVRPICSTSFVCSFIDLEIMVCSNQNKLFFHISKRVGRQF